MYAYKEIVIIDDPQRLVLKKPLPLRKGQRVEVFIVAENDEAALESVRDEIARRGISESDIKDAIEWARSEP
jgi:predicted DNA-binding antitoxin AbrB/MazE fold protein